MPWRSGLHSNDYVNHPITCLVATTHAVVAKVVSRPRGMAYNTTNTTDHFLASWSSERRVSEHMLVLVRAVVVGVSSLACVNVTHQRSENAVYIDAAGP